MSSAYTMSRLSPSFPAQSQQGGNGQKVEKGHSQDTWPKMTKRIILYHMTLYWAVKDCWKPGDGERSWSHLFSQCSVINVTWDPAFQESDPWFTCQWEAVNAFLHFHYYNAWLLLFLVNHRLNIWDFQPSIFLLISQDRGISKRLLTTLAMDTLICIPTPSCGLKFWPGLSLSPKGAWCPRMGSCREGSKLEEAGKLQTHVQPVREMISVSAAIHHIELCSIRLVAQICLPGCKYLG